MFIYFILCSRMRIFDEYWFSLGEDIKGKKELMRKEKHKATTGDGDSDSVSDLLLFLLSFFILL